MSNIKFQNLLFDFERNFCYNYIVRRGKRENRLTTFTHSHTVAPSDNLGRACNALVAGSFLCIIKIVYSILYTVSKGTPRQISKISNRIQILSPFSDAFDNFSICAYSGVLAASDAFSQVPPIIAPLSDANSIYIEYASVMGDFLVGANFFTHIERIWYIYRICVWCGDKIGCANFMRQNHICQILDKLEHFVLQ